MTEYKLSVETEDDESLGQFADVFIAQMIPEVLNVEVEKVEE